MKKELKFDTLQVHAGQNPDPTTGSRAVPLYQTTAYVFDNSEHASKLFALEEAGNIYTRIMNPTTAVLEERVAALEGGKAALAVSSGSSAVTYAILAICQHGDHIVAANTLYGGTYNLFANTLPRFGITTEFVDPADPKNFAEAVTPQTKAIFIESIGNPNANVVDIENIAKVANEHHLPLIVDNTFATPYLLRPLEYGANIVVHSATKFMGGHGTSIGGVIVDGGNFDWGRDKKFPLLSEPEPGYHGLVFSDIVPELAFITRARVTLLRDTGAAISPFNAFLILQGLETLSLRMEKHIKNAKAIAEFLEAHPKIESVNYPNLASSPYKVLAERYFPKGAGAVFTFNIKGSKEDCTKFIDQVQLFSHLANVGDAKSLIIHPASTTHQQLSEEQQRSSGITPTLIRTSIGIEDVDDLITDLNQALENI